MSDPLRDRLIGYLNSPATHIPVARRIHAVTTINSASLADALLPFIRDELAVRVDDTPSAEASSRTATPATAPVAMNFDVLRIDLIDQLCTSQWIGGPDAAYCALRERTILQVDAILPVIKLHEAGTACRCAGPVGVHEVGSTGCRRS